MVPDRAVPSQQMSITGLMSFRFDRIYVPPSAQRSASRATPSYRVVGPDHLSSGSPGLLVDPSQLSVAFVVDSPKNAASTVDGQMQRSRPPSGPVRNP